MSSAYNVNLIVLRPLNVRLCFRFLHGTTKSDGEGNHSQVSPQELTNKFNAVQHANSADTNFTAFPMPVCRYEVLNGSPEGAPVFYAIIGQMVYHKVSFENMTRKQTAILVDMRYRNKEYVLYGSPQLLG
jgi:hypothetical protein